MEQHSLEKQALMIVLGIIGVVGIAVALLFRPVAQAPETASAGKIQEKVIETTAVPQGVAEKKNGEKMSDKLIVKDTKVGTGAEVKAGDTISIHYKGTLQDGKEFDSSYKRGQPFVTQIGVGMVIEGWDQGVLGMKVGGKRTLIIPPELGYGANGAGGVIPPNATLTFEVELVGIK